MAAIKKHFEINSTQKSPANSLGFSMNRSVI
ncbi:hypothetical protein ATW7_14936 [Alteromonadales bacterium TW-7]|nr:hypothetical protein ATW7_14936 [Alteromonadales bacterium TW-7]